MKQNIDFLQPMRLEEAKIAQEMKDISEYTALRESVRDIDK